ncbi:major facilitator superfamily MFS_1 [Beutenbergia cavernae DSM 12333]|uniref:Major facilitator superfamily MFS_1 n=1 Tax=Beutenbergia cavernae (strain ATCC BAA-8 / DSM 12333 / CCUG 43141 / JCM 11478 / NBRC 16432 / NCIMB 13614 / HKI 0122) TaxID=471853 RepID=C5C0M7_BEUC1|nr:MFS transporter [Beutenbergia cavernae]ACQ81423.1 major facilitator superfamily MFS_1 [Beutenbergia cavernae DSM 12333]
MSAPSAPSTAAAALVGRASYAVFAVFALNGFLFAGWVSRLPAVRDLLGLSPAQIGLILLVGSAGSVLALPLTGAVVVRIGTARTVLVAAGVACLGMGLVALAVALGLAPMLAACLFVAQIGIAGWDVAMNLEGAAVERLLGRAIMPRYHAGFSVGTVAGAGFGALSARLGLDVSVHLVVVLAVVALAVVASVRFFLPAALEHAGEEPAATEKHGAGRSVFGAWLEPRTLLIGLLVLSAALTEGAANDWLSLAVIEGFELRDDAAALVLAVFLASMTGMRFFGTGLLDRFGRVAVLRLCIALALVGLALFALAPWMPVAVAGAVLWGFGAALGFPVGMSAASDDPAHAAARVSVVASIGYTAFLAGPPLLGLLAEHVGYRNALLAILVPLAISLLVTRSAAPPGPEPERPDARG